MRHGRRLMSNSSLVYLPLPPEISGDEYWVMDAQGRPVKVSGGFPQAQMAPLPVPKQAPSAAEIKMLQQQMLEQRVKDCVTIADCHRLRHEKFGFSVSHQQQLDENIPTTPLTLQMDF